jgi:hypothetical protein
MSLPELTAIDNEDVDDSDGDEVPSEGNRVGHSPSECAASIAHNSSFIVVIVVAAIVSPHSMNLFGKLI